MLSLPACSEAYWDNNDAMFLGRVPQANVDSAAAYEYFVGFDGEGTPTWSSDTSQAQPSIFFGRMMGENAAFFNPYLGVGGRYVIANFGLIDDEGNPRPWHSEPYMMPHRTQVIFASAKATYAPTLIVRPPCCQMQLTMFEAPNPWGPWSMFFRDDDSVHQGAYT